MCWDYTPIQPHNGFFHFLYMYYCRCQYGQYGKSNRKFVGKLIILFRLRKLFLDYCWVLLSFYREIQIGNKFIDFGFTIYLEWNVIKVFLTILMKQNMPIVFVVLTSCKNNWLKKCTNNNYYYNYNYNNGNMLYTIFIYLGIKAFTWHGECTGSLISEDEPSFCAKYFKFLCKKLFLEIILKKTLCRYVRPYSVLEIYGCSSETSVKFYTSTDHRIPKGTIRHNKLC